MVYHTIFCFFVFKQKTAYEMRISDWSSDVCSSDLDVDIDVPPAGQALADTLRTATAHMLVSRVGPSLRPGTRSYARSWIRDGAMISEGLLRMGRTDAVREYVEWYAPYQFDDGMVPCCVDDRGSDPASENDSHGGLISNIADMGSNESSEGEARVSTSRTGR